MIRSPYRQLDLGADDDEQLQRTTPGDDTLLIVDRDDELGVPKPVVAGDAVRLLHLPSSFHSIVSHSILVNLAFFQSQ